MGGKDDIGGYEYIPANQCFAEKPTTHFGLESDMDQMKAMVQNADPATVKSVAQGWAALSKDLVGSGGIKESLDTAVQHVMAHWEGDSAELFKQRAQVISKKLTDSSKYADNVSVSLTGAAAVLEDIKPQVMAMEKPGKLSRAADFIGDLGDRDGGPAADNALRSGATSGDVLANNEGSLSAGREAQLRMAEKMEVLGAAYNSRAKEMGSWTKSRDDESDDYPGDPGGIAPAPVVVPTGNASRSPQRATAGTAHGSQVNTISSSTDVTPPSGITGGAHQPAGSQPQVGTAIDGISGGRAGAPTIGSTGPVSGGSAGGGHVGAGGGFVGGVAGGAAVGAARGAMASRAGGAGMTGRVGGGGAGMAGRAGVGGAGASKGGAGAGTGGAGRVGGTARGGVVGGTPKAGAGAGTGAGRGTAGGSGLHNSRGAAGRGASAVRKGGMAGVPGSRTGRAKEEEGREGERPDYLVEDEETWAPQTDAAPPVIE